MWVRLNGLRRGIRREEGSDQHPEEPHVSRMIRQETQEFEASEKLRKEGVSQNREWSE